MLKDRIGNLTVRGLLVAAALLLIYFCGVVTVGLMQHAQIKLPGIELSWGTASEKVMDRLVQTEALLASERSSRAALAEQLDSMSTGLNRAKKDLNSTDSTLDYYKNRTTELTAALEKAKENKKLLERIAGLTDSIRQSEGVLHGKLAALKEASLAYTQLKNACEKGEVTDRQLCGKTTERQNILAALKTEVDGIQRETEENRSLYRNLAKKLEDI